MKNLHPAVVLLGALVGSSGCDSDDKTKTPDAFIIHDMGIDSRSCTAATAGMLDVAGYDERGFISWVGELSGLSSGLRIEYQFQFFTDIEPSLAGTFDLKEGNQANYKTCAVCVLAFAYDSQDQLVKTYFQSGGSITLTQDPFSTRHIVASLTNLQLEEVTIDDQSFTSTPVAGGECASFASFMVDHDKVPNAWTCTHADYDNGTNCNCMCGSSDPDCSLVAAPVMGCTVSGQTCFDDACVTPPTNDTCATATPLTIGTPVTGTTIGASRNYDSGLEGTTCAGFAEPGPDVVYSVALTAGQAITVTLSGVGADYDAGIALVGPGAATLCAASPITTCVAGADKNIDGETETFMYTATTAGTYFLIVDGFGANEAGAFTLNVTSL